MLCCLLLASQFSHHQCCYHPINILGFFFKFFNIFPKDIGWCVLCKDCFSPHTLSRTYINSVSLTFPIVIHICYNERNSQPIKQQTNQLINQPNSQRTNSTKQRSFHLKRTTSATIVNCCYVSRLYFEYVFVLLSL